MQMVEETVSAWAASRSVSHELPGTPLNLQQTDPRSQKLLGVVASACYTLFFFGLILSRPRGSSSSTGGGLARGVARGAGVAMRLSSFWAWRSALEGTLPFCSE